ncbi:MAG: DUF488 domain-containing protein, partial [Candidatus Cloacimonetes bacterium]|nr:DUF488 domain-containing protein [Candidatus Cloacimonadota bacterium]
MDKDAQVIFLLTYKHSRSEWIPLAAQEYSNIAYKIREMGLPGPQALFGMNVEEIAKTIAVDEDMALRITKLLELGGTASLYTERIFNQGIRVITRTDQLYPVKFKILLRDNTPPYFCSVGNIELLSDSRDPYIISANDITKLSSAKIQGRTDNLICLIDSSRYIKQLAEWTKSWNKVVIISSIGLLKLIRQPAIREAIQSGNTLIMSTNTVDAEEPNYHYLYLYLMAFTISTASTVVHHLHNVRVTQVLDQIRSYEYLKARLVFDKEPTITGGIAVVKVAQCEDEQRSDPIGEVSDSRKTEIYTIGHSNHEIANLLELLELNKIEILVDIRSVPSSKYATQFNQQQLKLSLKDIGIKYKYMGSALGGRPEDKSVLSSDGKIIREYIEQKDWYLIGIRELINLAQSGKKVALMCSEEDPTHCHRGYIVSNTLIDKGIQV